MATPLPMACENCQYWQQRFSEDEHGERRPLNWGECRHDAPHGYAVGGEPISVSAFAEVDNDAWCGSYIGIDGYLFSNPRAVAFAEERAKTEDVPF